ncbi:MAG: hypothetical protein EZS28_018669, partial [Streblomastix strix]
MGINDYLIQDKSDFKIPSVDDIKAKGQMLNDVQNLTINELKVKAQQIAEARDVSLTE